MLQQQIYRNFARAVIVLFVFLYLSISKITVNIYGCIYSNHPSTLKVTPFGLFLAIYRIMQNPWVKKIYLTSSHTIHLFICEKIPFANYFNGDKYVLIDQSGGRISEGFHPDRPTIVGNCSNKDIVEACYTISRCNLPIHYMIMLSKSRWKFVLTNGQVILCSHLESLIPRLLNLTSKIDYERFGILDMRHPDKVILCRK